MSLISPSISYSGSPLTVTFASGTAVSTTVTLSGATINISGAPVKISGETVIGKISGQPTTITSATSVITAAHLVVTAASGGTQLGSNTVFRATVRYNPSQSGFMWLGSTTNPPVSGTGLMLSTGDSYTADINNTNLLRIVATISGEKASYIGTVY